MALCRCAGLGWPTVVYTAHKPAVRCPYFFPDNNEGSDEFQFLDIFSSFKRKHTFHCGAWVFEWQGTVLKFYFDVARFTRFYGARLHSFQPLVFWRATDKLLADPTRNSYFIFLLKSCDLLAEHLKSPARVTRGACYGIQTNSCARLRVLLSGGPRAGK